MEDFCHFPFFTLTKTMYALLHQRPFFSSLLKSLTFKNKIFSSQFKKFISKPLILQRITQNQQITLTYLPNYAQKSEIIFKELAHSIDPIQSQKVQINQISIKDEKINSEISLPIQNSQNKRVMFTFASLNSKFFKNKFYFSTNKLSNKLSNKQVNYKKIALSLIKDKIIQLSQNVENYNELIEFIKGSQIQQLQIQDLKWLRRQLQEKLLQNCRIGDNDISLVDLLLYLELFNRIIQKYQNNLTQDLKARLTEFIFKSYFKKDIPFVQNSNKKFQRLLGICQDSKITQAKGRGAGSHHGGVLFYICFSKLQNGIIYLVIEQTQNYQKWILSHQFKKILTQSN